MQTSVQVGARSQVVSAMAGYGLTQTDIDEGWDLLKATSRVRASRQAEYTASPTVVANVDAWENRWYPVIDASLARRFPDIHATIFDSLSQTEGPPVLVGVSLLLDRIADLEKAGDKASEDARALLKDRGLTRAVIDEAKGYLTEATIPAHQPSRLPTRSLPRWRRPRRASGAGTSGVRRSPASP